VPIKKVKSQRTWQRSQSLWSETVADVLCAGKAAFLMRATIRRNSYDEQSYARVEAWMPGTGWALVLTRTIHECPDVAALSYVLKPGDRDWENRMLAACDWLLAEAEGMFA
jgi:hypothetical protein